MTEKPPLLADKIEQVSARVGSDEMSWFLRVFKHTSDDAMVLLLDCWLDDLDAQDEVKEQEYLRHGG